MAKPSKDVSGLRIGWKTKGSGWNTALPAARPADSRRLPPMVTIPAGKLKKHALIVGQSGAGKSVFIGRLIEEIMLRTRARCVVVDPNSDYFHVWAVNGTGRGDGAWNWKKWQTEDSFEEFSRAWNAVPKFIKTAPPDPSWEHVPGGTALTRRKPKFSWHQISPALIAAIVAPGDDAHLRRTVRNIHTFVHDAGEAYWEVWARVANGEAVAGAVPAIVNIVDVAHAVLTDPKSAWPAPVPADLPDLVRWRGIIGDSDTAWDMYKSFAARCNDVAMPFRASIDKEGHFDPRRLTSRLEVLDVASLPDPEVRALVTSAFLLFEWDRSVRLWRDAGNRDGATKADGVAAVTSGASASPFFPTFLVIDEAHNVIPRECATPYAEVLRDHVRTIAAEGRKYGLWLILSSQRPDKLDTRVVSECENVAILRMVSKAVLEDGCSLLGVDFAAAKRCLEVPSNQGYGLLFGDWAGEGERTGTPFKGAARRTREGGVDADDAWKKTT